MTIVLGIDPSLASTGLCRVTLSPGRRDPEHVLCATVTSKPTDKTYRAISDRLTAITAEISEYVPLASLVVIESPSFASKFGHTHTRDWLWGKIYDLCARDHGKKVLVVSPSQRMKYATGKGNAQKDQVLAAAIRRWPDVEITGNDTADALILAAIGCRFLTLPIDEVPQDYWKPVMAKLAA
jgi:Holliday junction resolvasome RuvABC endonuclease subunit